MTDRLAAIHLFIHLISTITAATICVIVVIGGIDTIEPTVKLQIAGCVLAFIAVGYIAGVARNMRYLELYLLNKE